MCDVSILQAEEVRCVWWDPASLDWSDQGCQLSEAQTDLSATVCLCQHLTSFGIMFSGGAEAEDPVLSVLSDVLLVASSLCVLATQALLYFVIKSVQSGPVRSSLAAQLYFPELTGGPQPGNSLRTIATGPCLPPKCPSSSWPASTPQSPRGPASSSE